MIIRKISDNNERYKNEIPSFYANKRIIANDLFQFKGVKEADMDEVGDGFYHYLSQKNNLQREL
ncbi:hypothetical protein H5410_036699 [Solanum commersonii]|uniref:Uncharacterized protein n=1 Tax=Solanum commersonii TaxID=4109 RepID=A0A9J5Y497_SOLCO|nr:hypothetical protein H5410_036699 [Solanum commersonii]